MMKHACKAGIFCPGLPTTECDESSDVGRFYAVPGQMIFMECKVCLAEGEGQSPDGPGLLT